jgi:hypothetical protein
MSFDLPQQIDACKRRIQIIRSLIEAAKVKGEMPIEEERQITLEAELLRMLEAQLVTSETACGLGSSRAANATRLSRTLHLRACLCSRVQHVPPQSPAL